MDGLLDYFIDLADFFMFWESHGVDKFLRFFWFFFIFEFFRYVLLEFIVLAVDRTRGWIRRRFGRGGDGWERARKRFRGESPLLSIIVPGKNEGVHLVSLVRSLQEQTYRNFELIVVDDGSDDHTPVICRKLQADGKIDRYLRNEIRGGKASAANLGLHYARGKYIIHIDADSSFDRDAVEQIMLPFYRYANIGITAGNVKVRNARDGICPSLQAIEYLKSIAVGRQVTSALGVLRIVSGAFGAFRRDILERLGGWDVGPGLDGDITVKTRKLGYRVIFQPRAICYTSVPRTFAKLAKQRKRWSKSLVRFRLRKHRDIYYPGDNFRWSDFLTFVENIFFSLVLNLNWFIYLIDILLNFPGLAKYIIPANYLLYFASNVFQFGLSLWVSEQREQELGLVWYLPLMPLYMGIYMRFVRTAAYLMEIFFKTSYEDPWNPAKVSGQAREKGI